MVKYNPFRPGSIVGPGMFAGRFVELRGTEQALHQTKFGNPHHFLIHGERGIGKSSLLLSLQWVATGQIKPLEGENFKFLTVSVELEPSNTYIDIVQKVGSELRREVGRRRSATEVAKAAWEFLKRWEVAGVKYTDHASELKPNELLDELTHSVERTLAQFGREVDGILVLIDEADKAPTEANLGEFVKVFTERLTKRGCNQVCLGLAGLSTLLQNLRQSHESSVRIFEIFTLEPLLESERMYVIERGLAEAKEKNGFETSIAQDAKQSILELSEGYPHFLQQFSFCAFNEDSDNNIDTNDVFRGALDPESGAVYQLGLKYFHELYFDQIGADEYRDVLRAMAEHVDNWVTKAEIRKRVTIKESTLNNAIKALKKRHIILAKPGVAGAYRLPTRSFAVWIKAFTKAREEVATPKSATGENKAV
jgi:DNA polymerase III delta prime subunit